MDFLHTDLPGVSAGTRVRVDIDTESNVRLMDDNNFQRFQRNERHEYFGGHYKNSPVILEVPRYGNWHITIDIGGGSATIRSNVTVLTV